MLQIENLELEELKIVIPQIIEDERGYFMESWKECEFNKAINRSVKFVQECQSCSRKGVVRGMHFQLPPHQQAKLVRCIRGKVYDVAVDIRRSSKTFRKWVGVELSAENRKQLWIPEGFAHGFMVLSDYAEVSYKVTDYWHPECESSVNWSDLKIGIKWPENENPVVSEKDLKAGFIDTAKIVD